MCQGVVVSLVKFREAGKTKNVILKGVGSHSRLFSDNVKKLKRAEWRDDLKFQEVISIESDFSGWNKFTVESGDPSKAELVKLGKAYASIASSPSKLIAHVKKCKKIDDALLNILAASAQVEYEKVLAAAWADYQKDLAPAWVEYQKVLAQAWCKIFAVKKNRVKCLR